MARPKKVKNDEADNTADTAMNEPEVQALEPATLAAPQTTKDEEVTPEADAHEMSRYFRVINNSEQAMLMSRTVTRQRDLNLWGVHQFSDISRNSYARSFYFKEHRNAVHALEHAKKLLDLQ